MAKMARLFDATKCIGCRGCQVACKQWNQLPGDISTFTVSYQSHKELAPNRYTMIRYYESKKADGEMEWVFRKECCNHCDDPSCMKACPNDAIRKAANGSVYRVPENCVGCGYCATYCPFGVPKIDQEQKKMRKCTFCYDRISNNMKPACAKSCVTGAISYGPREQILSVAEARLAAVKTKFPNAVIYGKDEMGGLGMIYILPNAAAKYDLPENPRTALGLTLMKDFVQPLGQIALAGASVALGAAAILSWRNERMKGGKNDGQ